jgi:ubiquinone/menaquinone biosynthesis C-methylase UbiE
MVSPDNVLHDVSPVQKAFSRQAKHYDEDDRQNLVLQDMRQQVYRHTSFFLKKKSRILELNAGTGIDALHFASEGHSVLATDIAGGMVAEIEKKIAGNHLPGQLACQQCSYDQVDQFTGREFDYIFSNFGGLNCLDDLSLVTRHFSKIITEGAYVTFVIMPPVCPWELLWFFKGHGKLAFRRFHKKGVLAHLEGEYFKTYYHSLSQIKKAFGRDYRFIRSEGLCAVSPPPSRGDFPLGYPRLYRFLRKTDSWWRSRFPFNRCADHIIVTFQFRPL